MKKHIKLIFLDIDGVLNCETTKERCGPYIGIEQEKVKLLKELVDKTGAYLILISTWKYYWYRNPTLKCKQDELANYLDESLKKHSLKIATKTKDIGDPFFRSEGINALRLHLIKKNISTSRYVIFDDMEFDYKEAGMANCFIRTDEKIGLQREHIEKAIKLLNNKKGDIHTC